jgi:hypothetical protein
VKLLTFTVSIFLVCFVDIDEIVDHRCLSFLCFVDIGEIADHHCLNFPYLIFFYISLNSDGQKFHQYQQNKQ